MSLWHAIVISLLQGAFELFPVSSLGHTVLVPSLFGWNEWKKNDPNNASFVAFVVVLHLGTVAALLTFFWRDWLRIIAAMLRSIGNRQLSDDPEEHLGWLIAVGTIPAGIIGFLLEKPLKDLFSKPVLVASPIILAAGLLEVPKLFAANANIGLGLAAMGFVISGITAYLAVRFLVKYFETERLDPFGYYCIAFGLFCLVFFGVRAVI
ncbi:MAG: hypothetical protein LC793_18815 [Thermomicrobia bacterium]|nr:hypothetical protein [Thermomicrobia bacterium]